MYRFDDEPGFSFDAPQMQASPDGWRTMSSDEPGGFSFDAPPEPAAPAQNWNQQQVAGAYSQFLGREGSEAELNSHLGGGSWGAGDARVQQSVGNIRNSREAQGYSAVQGYQSQVQALSSEQDPTKRAQMRDKLARDLYTSLQQSGHDVKWQGDQLIVDGRAYDVAGASSGSSAAPTSSSRGASRGSAWAPVDPLTDLTFGSAFDRARPYDFTGFDSLGAADPATEELVMSILRNPESVSPLIADTLKARSKDELAEMAASLEADLTGERFALGYQEDSPFFRSERNAIRSNRDRALVDSNRTIDLEAAATNAADRARAAGIGMDYVGQRFGRAQTGEQNKQAAASSRQSATSLAGNLALNRAQLLTQDRQFNAEHELAKLLAEFNIDQGMWERFVSTQG